MTAGGPLSLSRGQARRITLAAQGFRDARPLVPTMRTLRRTLARTQLLQIDSVNVVERAHYMPLFSRMGGYDRALLTRAAERRPRRLVEYWAHVATFMPVELWPHLRHRMAGYRDRGHAWTGLPARRELTASLLTEIAEGGPATSRDLDRGLPRERSHWGWNWSETKQALEYLFLAGELAVAGRNQHFERVFDLPERVLPAEVLAAPTPPPAEAARELVRRAARAYGVATEPCLRDYFRMTPGAARRAVAELVEAGELRPVRIEGWERPAYLHTDAAAPRRVDARALLSPFDPVVWRRERTERIFDFRYRIEIYVPAARRVHGYYVLPFLLGDSLVARVDLKADRREGVLEVRGAWAERPTPAHPSPEHTAVELAAELRELAGWLGLGGVRVPGGGDLAAPLALAVGRGC
ncbi:MAG: crosslink repair DNA glycosylase YcaQ family protein [Nocardioidaceae bacterium]